MYKRKTIDVWDIEQNCGYGWEVVTAETDRKQAIERLKEYRANQPEYPVRLHKTREKVDA